MYPYGNISFSINFITKTLMDKAITYSENRSAVA